MRITGIDVIKAGERDLMDAITADLDWGAVEGIFRERHHLSLEEDIEYRKGDLVVHDNQIAYRLDFLAKVTLSVLLDRDGNCLSVDITGGISENGPDQSAPARGEEPPVRPEGYEQVISQLGSDQQSTEASDPDASSAGPDSQGPSENAAVGKS
jgi:hypothetical protein